MSNETQLPEACPFCGACLGIKPGGKPAIGENNDWARYTCGTYWFIGDTESERRNSQEPKCATAERDRLIRERDAFRNELSAVMPPDFKDWHQNNPAEWPQVAADVIRNLRQREADALDGVERLSQEADQLRARVKRLEEAGDAMERHIDNGLCLNVVTVEWNYAKEAKP